MTCLVQIKKLVHGADLDLPKYATAHSAGQDLLAAIDTDVTIEPNSTVIVPTGISISLPDGHEAQVRSRSGLAAKHDVMVLNSPGTIDADYRGEVKVILRNFGAESFTVTRGMRIAQMVVAKYERVEWQEATELEESVRGAGGFGSTGVN